MLYVAVIGPPFAAEQQLQSACDELNASPGQPRTRDMGLLLLEPDTSYGHRRETDFCGARAARGFSFRSEGLPGMGVRCRRRPRAKSQTTVIAADEVVEANQPGVKSFRLWLSCEVAA